MQSRTAGLVLSLILAQPLFPNEVSGGTEPGSDLDLFLGQEVSVEAVSIDVVVTNDSGDLVRGLLAKDFEIQIDGESVPITNFLAIDQGRKVVAERSASETGPDQVVTRLEEANTEPLRIVVFLDEANLAPGGRKRLLKRLPEFFEGALGNGAEIMVTSFSGSLQSFGPFAKTMGELESALVRARKQPTAGMHRIVERRSVQIQIGNHALDCDSAFDMMVEVVRNYERWAEHQRDRSLDALERVVDYLSIFEGRKAIVYVSDGLELQAAIDLFHYLGEVCPAHYNDYRIVRAQMQATALNDFQRVTAHANAGRVMLHTLEAFGLRGHSSASAEFSSLRVRPSVVNDNMRIANLQSPLFFFADETGGRAILNANDAAADLAEINEEMGTYYSIAYSPDHPGRGKIHRIRVRSTDSDLHLRHRRSYLHKSREQVRVDRAVGAFLMGHESNGLSAEVRLASVKKIAKGKGLATLDIEILHANLLLLPHEGHLEGRILLIIGAPDRKGKNLSIRQQEIPIRLASVDDGKEGSFRMQLEVEVPPGKHRLGVAIWDLVASHVSYITLPIEVDGTY